MNEFATVVGAVIPVFAVAVIGYIIRRLNWLTEEADSSLLRVNINLLFPCLILDAVLGNPALSQLGNLLLAPTVGFGTILLGLALAWWAARFHLPPDSAARGTFAVTVGIYNYSYIPLPLALLLYGHGTAGVLFVHNVGVELAMWTLGVMLFGARSASPHSDVVLATHAGADWKKIINPPVISILLALGLNAVRLNKALPEPLLTAIHWLGQCAIPMSLILIGAVVADHFAEFEFTRGWPTMIWAVLLRILVLPVMFLLLARYLPASVELKRVILLQTAMPSAVFPIVMSRHYGGEPKTALRVVLATSLVGLITIPLWLRFGTAFVFPKSP